MDVKAEGVKLEEGKLEDVNLEDVVGIVAVQLGRRRIAAEDRILEDLGAESLDVVNIVAAVEDRYGIRIEEQELPDIQSARDLHACARAKDEIAAATTDQELDLAVKKARILCED